MHITGSFINQNGDTVTVDIVTGNDPSSTLEVGNNNVEVYFTTADPVEIASEMNDTFDHLLRHSATIRLLTANVISEVFCTSCRDAVVNIRREGECLFAGFIEPQTYSQPYNEALDEIELNCVDALSALQYSRYKGVGSQGVLYSAVRAEAGQRTFLDIMTEILDGITGDIDITGEETVRYLFDGSKALDSGAGSVYTVFGRLSVSDLLFLGDEEDDVWQQDKVLEELLRYLNLHIVQEGMTFYIFSWETVKAGGTVTWKDLAGGQDVQTSSRSVTIATEIASDCDTRISIGEVYNKLLLTCDVKDVETIIEDPLDEESLKSPYTRYQKYCTEYSSDGEGISANKAFYAMCHDQGTDYGGGTITDWFVQVMRNSQWTFPKDGDTGTDLVDYFCTGGNNQQDLPNYLAQNPGAAILAIGSVERNTANRDNSPTSKVDMTNCLVIGVNGNGIDTDNGRYPKDTDIKNHIPYAVYTGNPVGANLSPADNDTTHYIVLSGKMVLNPRMLMTGSFNSLYNTTEESGRYVNAKTVPSRNNDDGRFYTRRYWKAGKPSDDTAWDSDTDSSGLVPFSGKGPEELEYNYARVGEDTDNISKVAVLACMLIVGDKCVVEKSPGNDLGTNTDYTGSGAPDDFVWCDYKTLEECGSEEEYYRQCFYIGFDPKLGDKIIGVEYDLQNNISYQLGIDAEGIAIPVRKGDRVSGQVRFMILGPVNTMWNHISRRHPTFFRSTSWSEETKPLLAHVSNIIVKSLEVKIYSDNGKINNTESNDLVYMSDTLEEFTNVKDDLEFRICSALTAAECQTLGVTNSVRMSTPIDTATGDGVTEIYDRRRGILAKPEKLYVDSFYGEYHQPRILMEQGLTDDNDIIGMLNHYTHPALGKTFFVQGISRNMMEGSAQLNLKEIEP